MGFVALALLVGALAVPAMGNIGTSLDETIREQSRSQAVAMGAHSAAATAADNIDVGATDAHDTELDADAWPEATGRHRSDKDVSSTDRRDETTGIGMTEAWNRLKKGFSQIKDALPSATAEVLAHSRSATRGVVTAGPKLQAGLAGAALGKGMDFLGADGTRLTDFGTRWAAEGATSVAGAALLPLAAAQSVGTAAFALVEALNSEIDGLASMIVGKEYTPEGRSPRNIELSVLLWTNTFEMMQGNQSIESFKTDLRDYFEPDPSDLSGAKLKTSPNQWQRRSDSASAARMHAAAEAHLQNGMNLKEGDLIGNSLKDIYRHLGIADDVSRQSYVQTRFYTDNTDSSERFAANPTAEVREQMQKNGIGDGVQRTTWQVFAGEQWVDFREVTGSIDDVERAYLGSLYEHVPGLASAQARGEPVLYTRHKIEHGTHGKGKERLIVKFEYEDTRVRDGAYGGTVHVIREGQGVEYEVALRSMGNPDEGEWYIMGRRDLSQDEVENLVSEESALKRPTLHDGSK